MIKIEYLRVNKSIISKTVFYILSVILFLFLFYSGIAPMYTLNEYEKIVMTDTIFLEKYDTLYNYIEVSSLVKEKTYKEALLKLSENDSIQLVVNIPDSTLSLYIKGVRIHQSQISYYKREKLFKNLPIIEQVYMFSRPIEIISEYSTFIKEPIFTREAPKDTIEAALNAWLPDTVIQDPAFIRLSAINKIDIILEQEESLTHKEIFWKTRFMYKIKMIELKKTAHNFFTFKKPEYRPKIIIKIPADEIRSIYRALPINASIVLRVD